MYERSRRLAVGGADDALGHRRELAHRLVAIVEARLRIDAERRVLRGGVTGVRADDGESLQQRARQRTATAGVPGGGDHAAVDAAIRLVEEAPVPLERQAHLEGDRVGLAVDRTGPFEHLPGKEAVRADVLARQFERPCRHAGRRGKHRVGHRERGGKRLAGSVQRGAGDRPPVMAASPPRSIIGMPRFAVALEHDGQRQRAGATHQSVHRESSCSFTRPCVMSRAKPGD